MPQASKICLLSSHDWPFLRQLNADDSQNTYSFNAGYDDADYLVVYDDLPHNVRTIIPQENRILFISEPPSIKEYSHSFLNQFGHILTPQRIDGLDKDIKQHVGQLCLPWHYGVSHASKRQKYKTYTDLAVQKPCEKQANISTIISNKRMNAFHEHRINTTQFLKENMEDDFHLFGRGFQGIDDKAEAIDPYQFHLVCENNDIENFWTEKLADAFLGYAFPFYSGCVNLEKYFPEGSFVRVDMQKPEAVLQVIQSTIAREGFYQERLPLIQQARARILHDYNLFNVIDKMCAQPENDFKLLEKSFTLKPQNPQSRVKQVVKKLIGKQ